MSILPFIVMIPMIPVAIWLVFMAGALVLDATSLLVNAARGITSTARSPK